MQARPSPIPRLIHAVHKRCLDFLTVRTGYWLSCAYSGTSMVASRRLSEKIRSCEVEYETRFSISVAKQVSCQ
jgi:hypothetical protein